MSERDEEPGLEALYRDVIESDLPDPELLARYATAPNELSENEREEVETAMRRSPAVVDELDTLRGFDFSRLDADRQGGVARASLLEVALGWLQKPLVVTSLVGAVAVAIWLSTSLDDPSSSNSRPSEQIVEAPTPPDSTALEREAASDPEPMRHDSAAPSLAQSGTGAEGVESPQIPAPAPVEDDTGDSRLELAERTPPNEAPVPEEAAPLEEPPAAIEEPEMLLAMAMPAYVSPRDAMARDLSMPVYRSDKSGGPSITILAPAHVARTTSAQPVLYWKIDRLPAAGGFHLTLSNEEGDDVVDNQSLPNPDSPGIQQVSLASFGVELAEGKEYRWSIAQRNDPESPPNSFGFGWIRYVPLEESDHKRIEEATIGERPAIYAELGYWYEALQETMDLVAAHPEDARPREALNQLLEQGVSSQE